MRQSRLSPLRLFNVATTTAEGWSVGKAIREMRRRFAADWRTIPAPAWRQWGAVLFIGMILCALLVWILTSIVRHFVLHGSLQTWDERILNFLAHHGPMSFQNAILLESFGNLAYLVPLSILCFVLAARARRPLRGLSFIAVYLLPRPIVALGWLLWDRHRPELVAGGIAAPPLHSYPSGHAALTAASFGFLAWLWVKTSESKTERIGAVLLYALLLIVVGLARVVLGTHWPSDIVAGWVVGLAALGVTSAALQRAEQLGGR